MTNITFFSYCPRDPQDVFEHLSAGSRKVNLADYDWLIIEKDRQYLTHTENQIPRWHWSPYHAVPVPEKYAWAVANKLSGRVRIFNTITGDIR